MPQRGRLGGGVIASLVGLAALIVFMIQNTEKIRVHFLLWHFTWSVWIVVLVAAVIGAAGVVRRRSGASLPARPVGIWIG